MKVRAIRKGFYQDSQVEVGQVFNLVPVTVKRNVFNKETGTSEFEDVTIEAKDQFSAVWMEKIDDDVLSVVPEPVVTDVNVGDNKPSVDENVF